MPEIDKNTMDPQTESSDESERTREAMRAIILRWIGERINPPAAPLDTSGTDSQKLKRLTIDTARSGVLSEEQRRAIHEALRRPVPQKRRTGAPAPAEPTVAQSMLPSWPQTVFLPASRGFNILIWIYGTLWVGFILGLTILSVGVYAFHWNNPYTNWLLRYVPLPYGFVRYHPIWYGAYRDEFETLTYFRNQQPQASNLSLTPEDIERILVRRTIANDLAWSYGLWVTNDEVTKEFNDIAAKAGSLEDVSRNIQALLGISVDEYKQRVIKPYILKKKLLEVLTNDLVVRRKIGGANNLQSLDSYLDQLRSSTSVRLFR